MRVSISFDYDSPLGLRQSFTQRYFPPDADQRGTDLLLDVLAKHSVAATFAVVGNAARRGPAPEHTPGQIRQIHAAGHEIASHSMWHRYLPALSDEQMFVELAESKACIEECIGAPVTGFIPPFNRPTQFVSKGAFSLSEALGLLGRGRSRQTIPSLLQQARFAGYRWCRVSLHNKLVKAIRTRSLNESYRQPFLHNGVVTIPVHLTGFGEKARTSIQRCLAAGVQSVVIYGHPSSAISRGDESAEALDELFKAFSLEMAYGRIQFCTLKDIELVTRNVAPVPVGVSPNSDVFAYPVPLSSATVASEPQAVVMPVTIMVPCRNERSGIVKLLDSILAQEMTGLDWEVIVTDGMSDDGTRDVLKEYHKKNPRIRLIDNRGRIVSTGLNAALIEARGEIILRMDAHTEYAGDYVRMCVDTLIRTGAQNVGGPARTRSSNFTQKAIALAYSKNFACGGAKFHVADYEGYVDTVPYGCWRRSTLVALGGFDEKLVRNQDDELNLRLTLGGGKIWQSPLIQSWYYPRDSMGRLFRQYFQYGFWKVAVIKKHRMPASWRHLVPATFVVANLAMLLGFGTSLFMGWEALALACAICWMLMMGAYALTGLLIAGRAAALSGWKLLPVMPFVFGVFHCSYGLGFLCGLIYWPFARNGGGPAKAFTALSR